MTTIIASTTTNTGYNVASDSTGTLVFQTGATPTTAMSISSAQVVTFTNPPVGVGAFPSGTAMLFVQTAAPTGWTKQTTNNDKALRVVSGAASTGGSVAFSTAFASQTPSGTVGNTTLTTTTMPSHTHTVTDPGHSHSVNRGLSNGGTGYFASYSNLNATMQTNTATTGITLASTGSDGAHNHTFTGTAINLAVQYVDVIIATKD